MQHSVIPEEPLVHTDEFVRHIFVLNTLGFMEACVYGPRDLLLRTEWLEFSSVCPSDTAHSVGVGVTGETAQFTYHLPIHSFIGHLLNTCPTPGTVSGVRML